MRWWEKNDLAVPIFVDLVVVVVLVIMLEVFATVVLTWREADVEADYACFAEDTQASAPMPTLTAI